MQRFLRQRQPKAGATFLAARSEEGLKNVRTIGFANTSAVVLHHGDRASIIFGKQKNFDSVARITNSGEGLERIYDQVYEHLAQALSIAVRQRHLRKVLNQSGVRVNLGTGNLHR